MTTCSLLESESAPLAGGGCVLVPPIDLYVLNRVAESELVNSSASSGVTVNLNDGELIDQLLSICLVRFHRDLETVWVERLVVEAVLGESEVAHGHADSHQGNQGKLLSKESTSRN